jgi:hypothetical protein
MGCGREPGGVNAGEAGVCPTTADRASNGINRGLNAGRYCWRVAGTLCGGKAQGTFAQKAENCGKCPFFKLVMAEEEEALIL